MFKTSQIKFELLRDFNFNAIICASGFEKRASYQAQYLNGEKKIVIGFSNQIDDANRINNDKIFRELGFKLFRKDGHEYDISFFRTLLTDIVEGCSNPEVNIYIDYSSMTRNWYALLLLEVKNMDVNKKVNLFLGYSFAKYSKTSKIDLPNQHVEPIFGYCNVGIPSKPTALILCLGNETSRVHGLIEYFDAETYVFHSDGQFGTEYSNEVEELNKNIILKTKAGNIFKYPIFDMVYTDYLLENVCQALLSKYRVVIAPCGPKPFTMLALINSLRKSTGIEVWKISPGEYIQKNDRVPSGEISVFKLSFFNDNL